MNITYNIERNPIISIVDLENTTHNILCIGDPHLGKVFKTGVPYHRLGDREKAQETCFNTLLNCQDKSVQHIVIVGDLFDKFIVNPTVVFNTYISIIKAVDSFPERTYYLIPGNHDVSKDSSKISSYQILYYMLKNYSDNLVVLFHKDQVVNVTDKLSFYLQAYNPFEIQQAFNKEPGKTYISFGHWDSVSINGSGYLPLQFIIDNSALVVSGHEHTYKQSETYSNMIFTGSMQPYSHTEDPDGDIYVTVHQEDIDSYNLNEDFKYKCLRISCDPYYFLSEKINCYSISYLLKDIASFNIMDQQIQDNTEDTSTVVSKSFNELLKDFLQTMDTTQTVKDKLTPFIVQKEYL